MEISTVDKIRELKGKGVTPIYSIWIVHEEKDDGTFDISVWDELESERDESLEEGRFQTMEAAEKALARIVEENPHITFVRLENVKN